MVGSKRRLFTVLVFILILTAHARIDGIEKVVYKFQEFPYKDTTKNEMAFREFESACEQSCLNHVGPSRFACVRECVSPTCYRALYAHDPLEDGEIDVRLMSFKGCFTQRLGRPRQ